MTNTVKKLAKNQIKKLLPKREKDTCKTDYGHIFVLAGSRGMLGAAILTTKSCLRTGAGLVTIGCIESVWQTVVGYVPEVMTLLLPETESGSIDPRALPMIYELVARRKIGVLAIGPGLSTDSATARLVKTLLLHASGEGFVVLDADGINALQDDPEILKRSRLKIIITPHPGEMSRLIKVPIAEIQSHRELYAQKFAQEYGVICVLKGHKSVVTNGQEIWVNPTGNPGMATAGSGDVLTGMIAALVGQMKPKDQAVVDTNNLLKTVTAAVYLHGLAGDSAIKDKTEYSLIASDIIEYIPEAMRLVLKE